MQAEQAEPAAKVVARVRDVLRAAFPMGPNLGGDRVEARDLSVEQLYPVPGLPTDLFGACALLLERAGAYHLFCPGCDEFDDTPYALSIPPDMLALARQAGNEWRTSFDGNKTPTSLADLIPRPPEFVKDQWATLLQHAEQPVFIFRNFAQGVEPPEWWWPAMYLLIAADDASFGVGRFSRGANTEAGGVISWVDNIVRLAEDRDLTDAQSEDEPEGAPVKLRPKMQSIAMRLNNDIASVQPKSKTPAVGCTMRTLTHNLSLLPHRGQIKTHWIRPPSHTLGSPTRSGFDLLLIPLPYVIDPSWFEQASKGGAGYEDWDWFRVKQEWLPRTKAQTAQFLEFVRALLHEAQEQRPVHGLAFPEYALNWDVYEAIAAMILNEFPSIELLIAGSSDNCEREKGNFVISSHFYEVLNSDGTGAIRSYTATSRPKHHRWRLNKSQIEAYGLEEALPVDKQWWEKIPIPPRELHLNVFREGSIFTALICEDLARSDPCHEVLRSLGPDLVFVLLMDGPQLSQRWPARYSTGLSDDPGSSVLTFTSRALVQASNDIRIERAEEKDKEAIRSANNWSIALWKDDENMPLSIQCPPESQATILRLKAIPTQEYSFDGRETLKAHCWRKADGEETVQIDISDTHPDLVELFTQRRD